MANNDSQQQEIFRGLKEILVNDLDLQLEADEITADVSLLEDGLGLDSVVIVELITHLEKRFGFHFDDQDLRSENFENLTALANLVIRERAAEPA